MSLIFHFPEFQNSKAQKSRIPVLSFFLTFAKNKKLCHLIMSSGMLIPTFFI